MNEEATPRSQRQGAGAAVAPGGLVSLEGRPYPLAATEVEARAEGGVAVTLLRQRYWNPYEEALEVRYTLPLPADGAVLGYTITMGDRRIVGEIQTREEADAAYRKALYEGRTAGLLEQDRSDTFQQRLGNVPGGTEVEVEIQVLHPMAFRPPLDRADLRPSPDRTDRGPSTDRPDRDPSTDRPDLHSSPDRAEWEYRFPTTVGVRYMGAPGRVTDAERLSPDRVEGGVPVRLSGEVLVAGPKSAGVVRSPTHAVEVEGTGEGVRVRLVGESALDRDLVLRWPALAPEVGIRVVEGGGLEGDDGRYALLTVLPPEHPEATHARDVTVLLDTSGSMRGRPLTLARTVVEGVLDGLDPHDHLELLTFGSRVVPLTDGAVPATAQVLEGVREALRGLRASGGTEMRDAVARALRPLRPGAQRQVILVSDGYIGFEGEVVAEAVRGLPEGVRFHAVGVGSAPNRSLTGGLARAGRGVELFALDEASGRECAAELRVATARPVLSEIVVSGDAVLEVAPARPRDVMADRPVVFTAELAPLGGSLEVTGVMAGREEPWRWVTEVAAAEATRPAPTATPLPLGALHGREVLADLELKAAAGTPRAEVDREIEARALRHRIVSRRTSLVAMSEEATVDPRAPRRRERLAVELPAGVSAEGVGLERHGRAAERVASRSRDSSHYDLLSAASSWVEEPRAPGNLDLAEGPMPEDGGDSDAGQPRRPSTSRRPKAPRPRRPERDRREGDRPEADRPRAGGPGKDTPQADRPKADEPARPGVMLSGGEVIHREGDLLVLEFKTPTDGFLLPVGEVAVEVQGGASFRARVDPEGGTPRGPHPAGVLVRLALRVGGSRRGPFGAPRTRTARVSWSEPGGTGVWVLPFALPPASGSEPVS